MLPISSHEAILYGRFHSPGDYLELILEGFRRMYDLLLQRRAALLAADGPLTPLTRQCGRFLFRDTQVYANILYESLHRNALRDWVNFSIELEPLSRAVLLGAEKSAAWPILAAELRAMELSPAHRRGAILGFAHGLAGIGYTILRVARPAQLPSVLLWETLFTQPDTN